MYLLQWPMMMPVGVDLVITVVPVYYRATELINTSVYVQLDSLDHFVRRSSMLQVSSPTFYITCFLSAV